MPGPGTYFQSGNYSPSAGHSISPSRGYSGTLSRNLSGGVLGEPSHANSELHRRRQATVKRSQGKLPAAWTADLTACRPKSPSYSMGRRQPLLDDTLTFPGPGSYQLVSSTSTRGFSFAKDKIRQLDRERVAMPGPGAYFQPSFGDRRDFQPSFRREVQTPNFPDYNANQQARSPLWSFSHDRRCKTPRTPSPGPGAYTLPVSVPLPSKY